jgi:hypothetical protein
MDWQHTCILRACVPGQPRPGGSMIAQHSAAMAHGGSSLDLCLRVVWVECLTDNGQVSYYPEIDYIYSYVANKAATGRATK